MKKILLSLFVGLIGLINFGYCDYLNNLQFITNVIYGGGRVYSATPGDLGYPVDEGLICFNIKGYTGGKRLLISWNGTSSNNYRFQTDLNYSVDLFGCFLKSYNAQTIPIYVSSENGGNISSFNIDFYFVSTDNYEIVSGNPGYTSLQCQTEYNLIPVSSVDENYCVNNGLCPSSECPDIPIGTGNWSALYINDIQHLGKPIINITFPDYLDWDYTTDDTEFNLDIVGYPVDTEYIDGIIRTQNYKPTSEDFTQLVGMLAPYSKYLLFLLFIFIIWAWIKKPFKSKKL